MDKLKLAGEGHWFWLGLSVLWLFTCGLHLTAQLHSEKQEFLLIWSLLLLFWVFSTGAILRLIALEYRALDAPVEESID